MEYVKANQALYILFHAHPPFVFIIYCFSRCPFVSWIIFRGIHTAGLRIKTQCENVAKLALALVRILV